MAGMSEEEELAFLDKERELLDSMKSLVQHSGWMQYIASLERDYARKVIEIQSPPTDLADKDRREYIAGEMYALHNVINRVPENIKQYEKAQELREKDFHAREQAIHVLPRIEDTD